MKEKEKESFYMASKSLDEVITQSAVNSVSNGKPFDEVLKNELKDFLNHEIMRLQNVFIIEQMRERDREFAEKVLLRLSQSILK